MSRAEQLDAALHRILPYHVRRSRSGSQLLHRLDEGGAEYMLVVWREGELAVVGTPSAEELLGTPSRIRRRFFEMHMERARERALAEGRDVSMPDKDIEG